MDDLSRLVFTVYRGARELSFTHFQDFALEQLKTFVYYDRAQWGDSAHDIESVRNCTTGRLPSPLQAPRVELECAAHGKPEKAVLIPDSHGANSGWQRTVLTEAKSKTGLRSAHCYRYAHELMTCFANPNTTSAKSLSLFRVRKNQIFLENECRLVKNFLPHLIEALNINQAVHIEKIRNRQQEAIWSMAVADHAGNLIVSEDEFDRLLEEEWQCPRHMAVPAELYHAITGKPDQPFKGREIIVFNYEINHAFFLKGRRRLPIDRLTTREHEIAKLIAQGLTYKEIARALNIAPATTRNHMQSILEHANVHNHAALAVQLQLVN